jgi:hypothetical protein
VTETPGPHGVTAIGGSIQVEGGRVVSSLLVRPAGARLALVLAHGAGAGMRHPFLAAVAERCASLGVATLRYQFPYIEAGGHRPDPPELAVATVRAAVAAAAHAMPGLPLVAGGKSFGGRMTSTAAAAVPLAGVRGLAFLGFPLHPPQRPGVGRAEHLAKVTVPMLFLQGTRDEFAELPLLTDVVGALGSRATLHPVEGADHSFGVLKRSGRTDGEVLDELVRVLSDWAAAL